MAGDYTRFTFHPQKDPAGVLMQQGRVLLGSDWNEMVELLDRRFRAETVDIIGRAVVPRETPDGFSISIQIAGTPPTRDLSIGPGRAYVHGLLAENHGAPPFDDYDPVLGEMRGTKPILYSAQPYFPKPPPLSQDSPFPHLVYLDVWEREVTWLQDPDLIDKAVGVDTATRLQTVWQVRVLPVPRDTTCATPDNQIPGWPDIIVPSAGRLSTAASGVPSSTDPCLIPPNGGYRGTENRLYRVEIHAAAAPQNPAQFKWSRDNASVASRVTAIDLGRTTLSVVRIGRDAVLRFQKGDWVEVTDNVLEFAGLSGEMHQVASVDEGKLTITLTEALDLKFDATQPERCTRVIRWDQRGKVRDPLGNELIDVDSNGGLIPVPATASVILEDGVQITFSTQPVNGSFRVGDHWCFAARTADASVELLQQAPPRGILHHYARLAVITFSNSVMDCRTFWPPDFGDGGCDCNACVTADSHNSGAFTIQTAINQVKATGGKVCLGPGDYMLQDTVTLSGPAQPVRVTGRGSATRLVQPSGKPAILIDGAGGVTVEELRVLTTRSSGEPPPGGTGQNPAFAVRNAAGVTIQRCEVYPIRGVPDAATDPAIALTGFITRTFLRENLLKAQSGIVDWQPASQDPNGPNQPSVLVSDGLYILDNLIFAVSLGIKFDPFSVHLGDTRIAGNSIAASQPGEIGERPDRPGGIVVNGTVSGARMEIASNVVRVSSDGIRAGVNAARIFANDIGPLPPPPGSPSPRGLNGILLSRDPKLGPMDAEVVSNRITSMAFNGIMILDGHSIVVDHNQLLDIGGIALPTISIPVPCIGIGLVNIAHAQVSGNTINGMLPPGSGGGGAIGIWVISIRSLQISGNEISEIAPLGAGVESAGIEIQPPFERLLVEHNNVRRSETPPQTLDKGRWRALYIDAPGGGPDPASPSMFPLTAGRVLMVLGNRMAAVASGLQATNILGNFLAAFGSLSAVEVRVGGPCNFTTNQVISDNPPNDLGHPPVVFIRASAIVAGNNYVKGVAQRPVALVLQPEDQGVGPFTVLGNITAGTIMIMDNQGNQGLLPPPWAPLNVHS